MRARPFARDHSGFTPAALITFADVAVVQPTRFEFVINLKTAGTFDRVVLPVRIELTTSPFITLTLSRPPRAAFLRWTIPSP